MANNKQSELEKIGIKSRDEHQIKNDFNSSDAYSAEHKYAQSRPDDTDRPELGKGTNGSNFTPFRPHEKFGYYAQIDTENGGSSYDIKGNPNVAAGYNGREYLLNLNLYNANNPYGKDSVEIDDLIDGQFFVR